MQNVNRKFSVSAEMDADYLSAVEKGDTKTAERLVYEAAIFEYAFKLGMQIAIETLIE